MYSTVSSRLLCATDAQGSLLLCLGRFKPKMKSFEYPRTAAAATESLEDVRRGSVANEHQPRSKSLDTGIAKFIWGCWGRLATLSLRFPDAARRGIRKALATKLLFLLYKLTHIAHGSHTSGAVGSG